MDIYCEHPVSDEHSLATKPGIIIIKLHAMPVGINLLELIMAQVVLETESTLTDRFQTTVPSSVRQALHLGKKDKIKYTIQADGNVLMSRVETTESDLVLGEFLSFIATDIRQHPEKLQALTASMRNSVETLVANVEIDLEAPLSDKDE